MPVENLKVVYRPTSSLAGYNRNSRTHSTDQVRGIANSMREFGFTNPILLQDDNATIGAGHGRWEAAKLLGLEKVPTITLKGLTDDQWRAYVIADNKLALDAGWDAEMLKGELASLQVSGFDMALTGFSQEEMTGLFGTAKSYEADPDDVPEPPPAPISQPGDLWLLGDHRLICGDSTNASDVERVLGGRTPHLMVTDPPYGVNYDANWRNEAQRTDGTNMSGRAVGRVMNDDRADWREAWALFPGEVAYVWHSGTLAHVVALSLQASNFEIRSQIIWNKSCLVIGRGHYHPKHEPCFYAVRKGGTGHWQGDRKQTTVWDIDKPQKSETGHSTQKPVECMKRPIENNSKTGDYIYEPFSGSGTTIISGQLTGRRVLAIELDPTYVDTAVLRWMKFTGDEAVLESTGQGWDEVKTARTELAEPAEAL